MLTAEQVFIIKTMSITDAEGNESSYKIKANTITQKQDNIFFHVYKCRVLINNASENKINRLQNNYL